MKDVYDHKKIEKKWQEVWDKNDIYKTEDKSKKPKYYCLVEFPYPSGDGLHAGHIRSYTAMDIVARKRRAEGKNVLFPIGWDAFGLPTENYAIKTKTPPKTVTKENTDIFRRQLKSLGLSFDWAREINTTDPKYYKWTQWIFLQLFKKGLAYKAKTYINWCPKDKIGLANEEVVDGRCERCDTPVEKRMKEQWMLAITKYADRLDKDLDNVDYLEKIKIQQRNWIGKSEGLIFTAPVKDTELVIQTFSTHYEAFYADTFVVIAPDHPFLSELLNGVPEKKKIMDFCDELIRKRNERGFGEEKEPEGIFTGRYIVDPIGNGDLPIWVASYALADYGTGIVKCSCHDERDFIFAKKYGIKLKPVLFPENKEERKRVEDLEICYSDMRNGELSEPIEFAGEKAGNLRKEIADYAEKNGFAVCKTQYRLRDWVFSRQRYWGEPIPLIFCEKDGWVAVPDKDLPVELPEIDSYMPTDSGESPLSKIDSWVKVKCPKCGASAKRETDTMPNWAGSSWYYLRYIDPDNDKAFADKKKIEHFMPVNWYNGGMEHTTLHLLYSRFWHKFLFDIGAVSGNEPYQKRTSHGMILAEGGEKMSKSKGNVVNPDAIVETYGADTLRLYEMFIGPFDQAVTWSTESIVGPRRFLERVWNLYEKVDGKAKNTIPSKEKSALIFSLHSSIKKISEDIENMSFNTSVSQLMILANALSTHEKIDKEVYETFLRLLAPFAPHMTEEIWSLLGHKNSIHEEAWPIYDESKLENETVTIGLQVNSKVRSELEIGASDSEEEVKKRALSDVKITFHIKGKEIKKIIYVPGKLVNIVTN